MKAVRCPEGHWFDAQSYAKCPHCGLPAPDSEINTYTTEKDKKGAGFFSKKNKKAEVSNPAPVNIPNQISVPNNAGFTGESEGTIVLMPEAIYPNSADVPMETADDVTERFFADIDDEKTVSMFALPPNQINSKQAVSLAPEFSNTSFNPSPDVKVTSEPLSDALQRMSSMDEGKTLSYFNAMTSQNTNTADEKASPAVLDPVVGWLVCIEGVHKGQAFHLHVGKNTIGRNDTNKVVMNLDRSISRENHATIIYEPKKREFYLQTGNTDSLIYLNETFVDGMQAIKDKDILEIGASKCMFVPLCGTDFSWEQYI